jgi:hypothetical protein
VRAITALLAALLLVAGPASANSTYANWTETWIEFDGEEWQVTGFMWDDDSEFDLVDIDPLGTPGVLDDPFILAATVLEFDQIVIGTVLEVVVPNFFDPLPMKIVELLFIGQDDGAQGSDFPRGLDIIGADAPFFGGGPAVPVLGTIVAAERSDEFFDDTVRTSYYERWDLFPNPDFETVKVFIPVTFELSSFHITTQSVPEPSTLALVSFGLVGLVVGGKRRS